MIGSITVPSGVVNILDKYHKNPLWLILGLVKFYTRVNNLLEKYDKY
jgi:hypothetical protein